MDKSCGQEARHTWSSGQEKAERVGARSWDLAYTVYGEIYVTVMCRNAGT